VHDLVNHPYIGYWDINSCYLYKDANDGSALGGEYFYRTGATDSSGYCSNAYSGNLLNYVATSAIDVLRLALTGGNQVLDTAGTTVLERAYLYNGWGLNDGTYFPVHKINKSLLGKVMPNGTPASGSNYVYGGSCLTDLVQDDDGEWFGLWKSCKKL
jgi:type IV pilus assembly protein PilY1